MKRIFLLACCLLTLNTVVAEEAYVAPTKLNSTEVNKAVSEYISNATTRDKHHKDRLARAKQNNQKMASPGTPLQKPYFGDTPMH